MSINGFKCGTKCAFSLIELMITIIVIMIIMGSITPSITKKLNNRSVKVGGTIGTGAPSNIQFEPDCSHINEDCELCTTSACWLCLKVCPVGQYAYTSDCTCQSCSDKYGSECLSCTDKKCKTCEVGYYIENDICEICPIGHSCNDGIKTICPEGQYQDEVGKTSCKKCEVGYYCTNGIKSPCEAGSYSSTEEATSCTICEKGYYCPGGSDRIQCDGTNYQDEVGKSSCKDCSTNGYYVSDDKTSCNICEAGNYCTSGIKAQCEAGKYSSAGASSCTNCSAGSYSSIGASNCTTCSAGTYADSESSTSCVSCSTKTANCTSCDVATGTCTACANGYVLSNGSCVKTCGNLAMEITLNGNKVCMTKYNIGDKTELPIASGVTTVTAGSGSCASSSTKYCCWKGTTSNSCDSANGGYSGCTRTVYDWRAANESCNMLTYLGRTWRLPINAEMESLKDKLYEVTINLGLDGLMFCDRHSGYASAVCTDAVLCSGSPQNYCDPYDIWASYASSTTASHYHFSGGVLGGPRTYSINLALTTRCVSEL